jgi:hypothetical protein
MKTTTTLIMVAVGMAGCSKANDSKDFAAIHQFLAFQRDAHHAAGHEGH